jgi:hypothetical protein
MPQNQILPNPPLDPESSSGQGRELKAFSPFEKGGFRGI